MSMFPDLVMSENTTIGQSVTATEITTPKEYAWDFENNKFLLRDGKFIIVEGKEALKVWIWKALNTLKITYSIYSDNYGHEFDSIVGQGFSSGLVQSEAKRLVEECLLVNPHITGIANFTTNNDDDTLAISFTALTDQGEVELSELQF
jgi:hypothetical protein